MRLGGVAVCAMLLSPSWANAERSVLFQLRIEAGTEYDSNPERLERVPGQIPPSIHGSGASRLVLSTDVAALLGRRLELMLSGNAGLRAFWNPAARVEDVAVVQ